MDTSPSILNKVRGVIVHDGKLFLCKLADKELFFLPGGTMEPGETRLETLERECIEELAVRPEIGSLLTINEFTRGERQENTTIDFWYAITNPTDFLSIDLTQATHGHKHSEVGFYELSALEGLYKPNNLDIFLHDYLSGNDLNENGYG